MIFDEIKDVICEQLEVEPDEVTMDTTFEELGADSLDLYQLVMAIEEEYGCDIPSDDVAAIATVEDVIKYLKDNGIEE